MYAESNRAVGRTVSDYANQACVTVPVAPERQIVSQMARLHRGIQRLAEAVERTEQKFCTLLSPTPALPESGCKEPIRASECAMSEELNAINTLLEGRTNYLLSMIDRAEL